MTVNPVTILPYSMQSSSIAGVALRSSETGRMSATPATDRTAPNTTVKPTIIEKVRFASSGLPSPSCLATSAVPPVPIMKPMPPNIIMNGMTRLIAAKAVFPA